MRRNRGDRNSVVRKSGRHASVCASWSVGTVAAFRAVGLDGVVHLALVFFLFVTDGRRPLDIRGEWRIFTVWHSSLSAEVTQRLRWVAALVGAHCRAKGRN